MPTGTVLYRAAWVCPVVEPLIKNGCVLVVDGRIAAVEPFRESMELPRLCRTIDLGNVAIVPGLVNAHTQLEFSQLEQPLGQPGIKFTDWVRLVVGQRTADDPPTKHQSIVAGIQESFQAGVWAVGDIATDPVGEESYLATEHKTPVHTTVFLEQLGRKAELLEQQRSQLDVHLLKNGLDKILMHGIRKRSCLVVRSRAFLGGCLRHREVWWCMGIIWIRMNWTWCSETKTCRLFFARGLISFFSIRPTLCKRCWTGR